MKGGKQKVRIDLKVSVGGVPIDFSVDVPKEPTTPRRMLPVFRSVCGSIVRTAVSQASDSGREVSCKAGCAACCRHLVPVSAAESAILREIIQDMPADKREVIKQRFSEVIRRLDEAGLLERLNFDVAPTGTDYHDLAIEYLSLDIACPFLEDEACTIYSERPLVCREYMVVSEPENCLRKNGKPVEAIALPLAASKALFGLEKEANGNDWTTLALALNQAESEPRPSQGTAIATQFFNKLTGNDITKAMR